jgi:tetratricopeptide (TPR) repeat protein/Cdc6-like AAA superfamily ATPase
MPLSNFSNISKLKAVRTFTDRKEPLNAFKESLFEISDRTDVPKLKVLTYYGAGGIGKTSLAKKILEELHNGSIIKREIVSLMVSLDAHEYDSPIDILVSIRNLLPYQSIMFDIALVGYLEKLGIDDDRLEDKSLLPEDSIIWELIDIVSPVPGSIFQRIYKKAKSLKNKKLDSNIRAEISNIEQLSAIELQEKLPYYLGVDIRTSAIKKNHIPVFIFDTYEAIYRKYNTTQSIGNSWLKELIGSMFMGLHIILGRDYINWAEIDSDWKPYIEQHILGRLSNQDGRSFLSLVPITDEVVVNSILSTCKGVPLYLDLCVSIYMRKLSKGILIQQKDFDFPQHQVVERFLRHLEREEKELVKILSICSFFDFELFTYLNKEFTIGYPETLFYSHINSSLIHTLDTDLALFKIHDHVRDHVIKSISDKIKYKVHHSILSYIEGSIKDESSIVTKKYIGLLINNLSESKIVDSKLVLKLHYSLNYLIDQGHWLSIKNSFDEYIDLDRVINPTIKNLVFLYTGIIERRTGKLVDALRLLKKIDRTDESTSVIMLYIDFNIANVTRLLGNYNDAEPLYQSLYKSLLNADSENFDSIKIKRQVGDFLMLKGEFENANNVIHSLPVLSDNQKLEDLRIIGHILRFNAHYSESFKFYSDLYENINKNNESISLQGKLLTNIIESACWLRKDNFNELYNKFHKINSSIGANIELGKGYVAKAYHSIFMRDKVMAKKYIQMAIDTQKTAGYKSGIAFGLVANCYWTKVFGTDEELIKEIMHTNKYIDSLGVYLFLKLDTVLLADDQKDLEKKRDTFQWKNFDRTVLIKREIINEISMK